MGLKEKKFKSKKYLKAVSELPCCVCGDEYSVVPHHIKSKNYLGTGYKSPDDLTMPLCHRHHQMLHDYGYIDWEKNYGSQEDHIRDTQGKLYALFLDLKLEFKEKSYGKT